VGFVLIYLQKKKKEKRREGAIGGDYQKASVSTFYFTGGRKGGKRGKSRQGRSG